MTALPFPCELFAHFDGQMNCTVGVCWEMRVGREGEREGAYLTEEGGSYCRTQSTAVMSMPRAATSVHMRTPLQLSLTAEGVRETPAHLSEDEKLVMTPLRLLCMRPWRATTSSCGDRLKDMHQIGPSWSGALTERSRRRSSSQRHR